MVRKRPIPKGKKPGKSKEPSKENLTRREELGSRAYEAERREKAQPERTVMARLFGAMNWKSNRLRRSGDGKLKGTRKKGAPM